MMAGTSPPAPVHPTSEPEMNHQTSTDDTSTARARPHRSSARYGLLSVVLTLACESADDSAAGTTAGSDSCRGTPENPVDVRCNDCTIYGEGKLNMHVWGERFIEEGIPAAVMADGWAIKYERFLVHVSRLYAKRDFCDNAWLEDPTGYITNIAQPSGDFGVVLSSEVVPTGRYNNVGYSISPASVNTRPVGISPEDYALMTESGYSMFLSGWAQKGAVVKRFAWGVRTSQTYRGCQALSEVSESVDGFAVATIHGDHMFFNHYGAQSAQLTFGGYAAADRDGDGEITEAELRALPIAEAGIDPGPREITTAWEWLEAVSMELGHVDGNQHCFRTEENSLPSDVPHCDVGDQSFWCLANP